MKKRAAFLTVPLSLGILLAGCTDFAEQEPEVDEEITDEESGEDTPGAEEDNFDDDEGGTEGDPEEPDLDEEPSEE
ncbi:hypothetical protein [Bacillus sp. AK031]